MTQRDQYSIISALFVFNVICFVCFVATHILGCERPADPLLTALVGVYAVVQFGMMRAMRRDLLK
jgi:hypothetical protein